MIEVRESPLHGRGLFATQHIPEDTVIAWLATEPADETDLDGPYVLWVDGVQPVRVTCDMRYINHGDEPNAAYYDDLSVMAVRDIQQGEEILHNYMGDAIDDDTQVHFGDETDAVDDAVDELVPA